MIRFLGFNGRKPGMSKEEFDRLRWEQHAPLSLATTGMLRYVHYYIKGKRPSRSDVPSVDPGIDGFSEMWFEDMDAYFRWRESPEGKILLADGASYMGFGEHFIVEKRVVFDRWLSPKA